MIAFSTIFIFSAIFLYHLDLGDASLVYANTINLCARIAYCLVFSSRYFNASAKVFQLYDCLPPLRLWFVSGVSTILIYASERHFEAKKVASQLGRKAVVNTSVLCHVAVGVFLAAICLWTWWTTSGHYINIRSRQKME
jgi:oligosaccharide translocation protein RFT1